MSPAEKRKDDEITKAWAEFVARGGQCFDWTPNEDRCPRHKVPEDSKAQ